MCVTVGVSYLVIPSTVTHIYDSFLAGGMNLQAIYIGNVDQVDQLALTLKITPYDEFTVYVPFTILPNGWSDLWYDEELPLYVSYGNTIWNLLKNTEVLSFLPIIDGGIDDFDKDFEIKESLNISFDLDILNEFKQDVIIKEEEEYQVLFDAPKTTN